MSLSIEKLRKEIIGNQTTFETPYGNRVITYADYTASGKTLKFIENYLMHLQKVYANTHTEDSMTGKNMTEILHKSELKMKEMLGANDDYYIIPVGTGATGAISKLSEILGVYLTPALKEHVSSCVTEIKSKIAGGDDVVNVLTHKINSRKPVIFIGPYEHHSNFLIWKESFADVVEIDLLDDGTIDIEDLKQKITDPKYKDRKKIGSFSAASNITGVKSDVFEIARILHENDAIAAFDYAASGPYVDINVYKDEKNYLDAIFLSPHKFIGGPGSSGILVINKRIYEKSYPPTVAGGGTVDYVSSHGYEFSDDVETREKAGTPGILQVIKSSLALELKEVVGIDVIEEQEHKYISRAFERLGKLSNVHILGPNDPDKSISILSFNIRYKDKYLHHKYVAKILNDIFGIQSRAGCACAGPYGHRLLNIDYETSEKYRKIIKEGINSLKPGWVRVNFHYSMTEEEVEFILDAIEFIATNGYLFLDEYIFNMSEGNWSHKEFVDSTDLIDSFGIEHSIELMDEPLFSDDLINREKEYKKYMQDALHKITTIDKTYTDEYEKFDNELHNELCWFYFKHKK